MFLPRPQMISWAAVNRRMMQELVVAPRRECGALESDDPAQLALKIDRQLEDDRTAHRATDHDWTIEFECVPIPSVMDWPATLIGLPFALRLA